jgi:hypothetical protein
MSPPPPLSPIAKGAICFCLDEFSKGPGARARVQALRDAIADLAPDYDGLAEVFDEFLVAHVFATANPRQKILRHLKKYWFDDTEDSFFPGTPVSKIYAEGLLKTLDLVLGNEDETVPINSWWLLDQPAFMMLNLADLEEGVVAGSVTLLILTPRPEEFESDEPIPPAILGDEAEAFVTSVETVTVVKTERVRDQDLI